MRQSGGAVLKASLLALASLQEIGQCDDAGASLMLPICFTPYSISAYPDEQNFQTEK
jgi:hypothetical protein